MPRAILDPAILSRPCSPLNSASVAWGTAVSKMDSMASGPLVFLICVFRLLPARHLHWPSLTCAVKLRGGLGEPESPAPLPHPASALPEPLAAKIWESGAWVPGLAHAPPYGCIEICQTLLPHPSMSLCVLLFLFVGRLCQSIFHILSQPCIPAVTVTWS